MRKWIGTGLGVCLLAATAFAGDLEKAEQYAGDGLDAAAAKTYAAGLKTAWKKNAFHDHAKLAASMRLKLPEQDGPALASCLDVLIAAAGNKRDDATLCAGLLAQQRLLLATRTGTRTGIELAVKAIEARGKRKNVGACALAMVPYARAMRLLGKDDAKGAAPLLDEALRGVVKGGWRDLAAHVATELAATEIALGHPDRAADATNRAAGIFVGKNDIMVLASWRNWLMQRVPDAPPEVAAPIDGAMPTGSGALPPSGGDGTDGAPAGKSGTKFGKKGAKLGKRKPLLSVKRTAVDLVVHEGYDAKYESKHAFVTQVEYVLDDGMGLALSGYGVALEFLDELGGFGGLGGRMGPSPYSALFHLAEGETWVLARDGTVTIRTK